jgi:hypothetical protein
MFVPSATELVIVGGKNELGALDTVSIYTVATGINCFPLFYIALRYLTQAQFKLCFFFETFFQLKNHLNSRTLQPKLINFFPRYRLCELSLCAFSNLYSNFSSHHNTKSEHIAMMTYVHHVYFTKCIKIY